MDFLDTIARFLLLHELEQFIRQNAIIGHAVTVVYFRQPLITYKTHIHTTPFQSKIFCAHKNLNFV